MKTVKYHENDAQWIALHNAGLSNIYIAVLQLMRIGWNYDDICKTVEMQMLRVRLEHEEEEVKHIHKEGSRNHVVSYSTLGVYCSEPNCEVNRRRRKRIESQK